MKRVKNSEVRKLLSLISISDRILLTGHVHPDGDVIGSALGLYLGIKKHFRRKLVDIFFSDLIPEQFKFLPGFEKIVTDEKKLSMYDLCIMLECSDITRAGQWFSPEKFKYLVIIDHHLNHKSIGKVVKMIYPDYSSCAEIIFDIFNIAGIKLDKDIALCLYTGLVTDTGMFQWVNTNIHSFTTAVKLLSLGIRPFEVYRNIYRQKTYSGIILLSKVLSTLKIKKINRYKIAEITLTQKMLKDTNTTFRDTEDFINLPMSIKDVELTLFFKQENKDSVKISFRSNSINVEKLARKWSGGGHKNASGATVKGSLREVKNMVYDYLKEVLK